MNVMGLFELTGKKALVTGGAGGLGASIVEALAEAGAEVVMLDVSPSTMPLTHEFRSRGLVVTGLHCDVADRAQVRKSYAAAMELTGGTLDILVNAAGIQRRSSSENFSEEDWDAVLAINLDATFFFCQLAARTMMVNGCGKIINVASIMSFFGGITIPAYAASKGAVGQLTKALSNDWGAKGICVNAIAPGYMDTPLNVALIADANRHAEVLGRIPAGRWGVGSDIKGISVFLASAASDYVSGAVIPLDGGYSGR